MSTSHRRSHHDAVIVGARAAGAATAMLLARAGLDVLVVDRSRAGEDTLSTHALMKGAVLQLHRWGLLPRLVAAGTPPLRWTRFHVGPEPIEVPVRPSHGVDALYAPRRTVLDPLLAGAARAAGAEIRHGTTVTGLLRAASGQVIGVEGRDGAGRSWSAGAPITIGADGMSSSVARWVDAPLQRVGKAAAAAAYGYWAGLGGDGCEWFFRPGASAGVIPTNDGQTCVFVGTTPARFRRELVREPEAGYRTLLRAAAPELSERLAAARPPDRILRFPGRVGHLRQAWGPGWALVGDAGSYKDPITAHGLTDALGDAELLARAVVEDRQRGGGTSALAGYEWTRNLRSGELFTVTDTIASYRWGPTEVGELLRTLSALLADEVRALAAFDGAAMDGSAVDGAIPTLAGPMAAVPVPG